jgi:hypothetical protein
MTPIDAAKGISRKVLDKLSNFNTIEELYCQAGVDFEAGLQSVMQTTKLTFEELLYVFIAHLVHGARQSSAAIADPTKRFLPNSLNDLWSFLVFS